MKIVLFMILILISFLQTVSSYKRNWERINKKRDKRQKIPKKSVVKNIKNEIEFGDYNDEEDVGNDLCKVEGCLKGVCCKPGDGQNGKCRPSIGQCRAMHCREDPGEPGVSVQVKMNPGVWMCKSWDTAMEKILEDIVQRFDKDIVENIKNVNYNDLLHNIDRFSNDLNNKDLFSTETGN